MTLEGIGALLLLLTVIFFFGNLWFCGVEALLIRIRSLFSREKPAPWHPLPPEQDGERGKN